MEAGLGAGEDLFLFTKTEVFTDEVEAEEGVFDGEVCLGGLTAMLDLEFSAGEVEGYATVED